ncbi:MAG: ABC transporter ATP-binding protein [Oenococcus sp.]|uniref:ABC transporter ATP-binding protein n=1 Tax=Oenococcus TaxID=46254 RepID=UPI0021E7A070|nr:ABC transporter ATP-binding protein [Oenococcus kitaharae]MCV3296706.1 ABC transporter ATP-binding protein/permease [Oenococcus kitaharae]
MRNPASRMRGGSGPRPMARIAEHAHNFWGTTFRLFRYLGKNRFGVIFSIALAIISVLLSVSVPKILGEATTIIYRGVRAGLQSGRYRIDYHAIISILVLASVLYVLSALMSFLQQVIMTHISQRTVFRLRAEFKAKMARLPVSYYDQHQNGDMMSRVVNDMDNISGTLQQALIQIAVSSITFVAVIIFMLSISWILSLLAFTTIPISILLVRWIAPHAQKLFSRQQEVLGSMNGQVEETFSGHLIIKTFDREQAVTDKFEEQSRRYYHAAWKAQFISVLIFPAMQFLNNLDYLVIAVFGGIQVANGQLPLGDIQAFLQYTNQFSQPVTQIANLSNTIQSTIASAERIFQVLDAEEMPKEISAASTFPRESSLPLISFHHVAFSYDSHAPLIRNYSLDVHAGQTIAIVGPTGAGKTTVINLLERFYDVDAGVIQYRGRDIRHMTRPELRSHFAMVLQETWLFTGSVFENIKYGNERATKDQVIAAAKEAYADTFIQQLPQGYQTQLNEAASNISQGQRQLLTIARAFLSDPEILILDEATSSVDTRTELLIQNAMAKLQRSRTSFVVAHRLSTIQQADNIVVMNHGSIVETGTHQQLLDAKGFYADLFNAQFASGD